MVRPENARSGWKLCTGRGGGGGKPVGRGGGGGGRKQPYGTGQVGDRDMQEAEKFLAKKAVTKGNKKAYKQRKEDEKNLVAFEPAPEVSMNFAQKTIWGQNIIDIRKFNIDKPKTFEFLGSYASLDSMPTYPLPEIAFLGRSNVGKSSLLNCLTGRHKTLAVVSKTPGRTQLMNLFKCKDGDGDICIFVDLPGYGFAKMSREKQGEIATSLRAYLQNRGALRHVALLVDARREVQDQDLGMAGVLDREGLDFSLVATKVDKLKPNELEAQLGMLRREFGIEDGADLIPFSSTTGLGKKPLWRALKRGLVGISAEEVAEGGDMVPVLEV